MINSWFRIRRFEWRKKLLNLSMTSGRQLEWHDHNEIISYYELWNYLMDNNIQNYFFDRIRDFLHIKRLGFLLRSFILIIPKCICEGPIMTESWFSSCSNQFVVSLNFGKFCYFKINLISMISSRWLQIVEANSISRLYGNFEISNYFQILERKSLELSITKKWTSSFIAEGFFFNHIPEHASWSIDDMIEFSIIFQIIQKTDRDSRGSVMSCLTQVRISIVKTQT